MSRRLRELVTVSPPTFERTEFAQVDAMLDAPQAPIDREWLMARFGEGLQIRILREPRLGLVLFQPASQPVLAAYRQRGQRHRGPRFAGDAGPRCAPALERGRELCPVLRV